MKRTAPRPPARLARLSPAALVAAAALCACGVAVEPLEAFDVVLVPAVQCTRNASARDCVDPAVLAQQRIKGRWIFEHAPQQTFALTTEKGTSVTGVSFNDDGQLTNLDQILEGQPCKGEGGLCYFARRRFESTDPDTGCTRFGQAVTVIRRIADGTLVARIGEIQGTDEQCGTSTVVERVHDVTGVLSDEPALARAEQP
jgi:hypothetical protein